MREIPTSEPPSLTAGDSWQWDKTLPGFPASEGWGLTYALRGPGSLDLGPAEITPAGDGWQIRVPAAATAALPAGTYRYAGRVTLGTDVSTAVRGQLVVRANLATATDGRTHAERTLAILNKAIEGQLEEGEESYQVNGRTVVNLPMKELRRLRNAYATKVWQQRNRGKLGPRIGIRFRGP